MIDDANQFDLFDVLRQRPREPRYFRVSLPCDHVADRAKPAEVLAIDGKPVSGRHVPERIAHV